MHALQGPQLCSSNGSRCLVIDLTLSILPQVGPGSYDLPTTLDDHGVRLVVDLTFLFVSKAHVIFELQDASSVMWGYQ